MAKKPSAASVQLVRGRSERAAWFFRPSDLGARVSIGADKGCDWSLSTGGFERRELTLLFAGGILLARREQPGNRVRLDGRPLGDDWTLVAPGSRIEIGLACLEFQLAAAQAGLPPLPLGVRLPRHSAPQIAPSIALRQQPQTRAPKTLIPAPTKPKPDPTMERANLVLRSGIALERVSADQLAGKEPSPFDSPSRPPVEMSKQSMEARCPPEIWVQSCAPSGCKPKKTRVKLISYAVCGLLLALLYAGWLVLLERI